MTIKFNNHLDEPASDKQMQFVSSLLDTAKREMAAREPNEKGIAFLNALNVSGTLTKWEASSIITALKSNSIMTCFKIEHDRKVSGRKLTSTDYCAALRSAFPGAYKVLFGDAK